MFHTIYFIHISWAKYRRARDSIDRLYFELTFDTYICYFLQKVLYYRITSIMDRIILNIQKIHVYIKTYIYTYIHKYNLKT